MSIGDKIDVLALELRPASAETRVGQAEVRAALAELRLDMAHRHDTLFQAFADLRAEYVQHGHPEQ